MQGSRIDDCLQRTLFYTIWDGGAKEKDKNFHKIIFHFFPCLSRQEEFLKNDLATSPEPMEDGDLTFM